MNNISIHSNNGAAIIVLDSVITFYGFSSIYNNSAASGAGLVLIFSPVSIAPYATLSITNNFAERTVGLSFLAESRGDLSAQLSLHSQFLL